MIIKLCASLGLTALAIGTGKGFVDEPKPKPPILDVSIELAHKNCTRPLAGVINAEQDRQEAITATAEVKSDDDTSV